MKPALFHLLGARKPELPGNRRDKGTENHGEAPGLRARIVQFSCPERHSLTTVGRTPKAVHSLCAEYAAASTQPAGFASGAELFQFWRTLAASNLFKSAIPPDKLSGAPACAGRSLRERDFLQANNSSFDVFGVASW
jgi:hypothetical protein